MKTPMLNAVLHLNWLAILAASVANFALGGLWFMGLFKRQYAAALELEPQNGVQPSPIFIVGPFLCGAVTIATTDFLFQLLSISTLADALVVGGAVGIGLVGATTVNIAINPKFPNPLLYSLINVPYFVLGSLISSVILVVMD